MRIACLTADFPSLRYFANAIGRRFPVCVVIVERLGLSQRLMRSLRRHGPGATRLAVQDALTQLLFRRHDTARLLTGQFGDQWRDFSRELHVVYVEQVRAPVVDQILDAERPDMIVDHGTGIVPDRTILKAGTALNLHSGLSPYYRGSYCTEWALINRDPYNIGVTVHRLSNRIDGGAIAAQRRVIPAPDDTCFSLKMKLHRAGTELMIDVLSRLDAGERVRFARQDPRRGQLFRVSQWSHLLQQQIRHIERRGEIAEMLRQPARTQRFPLVKL